MKRERKFRVWNGIEMVYDVTVGKFGVFYVSPGRRGDGSDSSDTSCINTKNTKYLDGTPVMEFIGLYLGDTNLELWEGDIWVDHNDPENEFVIRWDESLFGWYVTNQSGVGGELRNFAFGQMECIGNIYSKTNKN